MGKIIETAKKALLKFGLEMKPVKKEGKKEEVSNIYNKVEIPSNIIGKKDVISREYKIFKHEEFLTHRFTTLYEKMCHISESFLAINPDKETKEKIEKAIQVAHINITPRGVASLTILSCLLICLFALIAILTNNLFGIGLGSGDGLLMCLLSIPVAYYLYTYPMRLERRYRIRIGSEISFLILYMVVYMRESPNLEGALEFASRNLSGPLAWDMRKLMWDVEVGKYRNVDDALIDYVLMWIGDRYFVESLQLLRASMKQSEERRLSLLDEAVDLVLNGTRERAKNYSQELKMPILMIHALGILLPVMGLVMFPVVGIFIGMKSEVLFIGYDIILPIILFFFINDILENRPVTFNKMTISSHPDMAPPGKFVLKTKNGKYFIPALPFAIAIALPIIFLGFILYSGAGKENLNQSIIITTGILLGFLTYYFLSSFQKLKLREDTKKLEKEFTEALFQLGNHVSSGVPIEVAVDKSTKSISGLVIKEFFIIILKNIRDLGMTFSEAIFDREYGAIKFFPSKLIRSIMRIVVDSSRKGVQTASITMLNISRHLKNLQENQEKINDMLEDVLSSLKFQGFLLTPLVSGIIVTMAAVIIKIIGSLGATIANLKNTQYSSLPLISIQNMNITPGEFQLVCSIYFIETSIIVGMFINGIENGEDKIGEQDAIASILLIGFIIYMISLFVSLWVFAPLTNLKIA